MRLNPDRQVSAWQLISVNINLQWSSDISTIKEKLLGPDHACTDTRKARAEHLVKSCLQPGKKTKRKPLTELYVKGQFTKDRRMAKKLQRDCEEVQESRIEYFKKKGNQQSTEDGRSAEITVDLVLQGRAKLSDNKVNGPEDAIVCEMIKKLPMEKIYTIARCFQERFMGLMESPSSWKIVKLVFLR